MTMGSNRKDSHRCSMALPIDLPRKPVPLHRYELCYQVAISTVAEALATDICSFRELHSDLGRNVESSGSGGYTMLGS
jgi:hypothetical protein